MVGSLALAGIPPFAGFFSKDAIIEAVHASHLPGSGFALFAVTAGVVITAFYSFRLIFLVFHGEPRMDRETFSHVKESPWVVTVPLILLAVPSVIIGAIFAESMLFGGYFGSSIQVAGVHDTLGHVGETYEGISGFGFVASFIWHGIFALPFWLAMAGIGLAWWMYIRNPELPGKIQTRMQWLHTILDRKYGFDEFNQALFAGGARRIGDLLWRIGDVRIIDGYMVNGTARVVGGWFSGVIRKLPIGIRLSLRICHDFWSVSTHDVVYPQLAPDYLDPCTNLIFSAS